MSIKECKSDEIIEGCPSCQYYQITLKDHTMNFFYCQNKNCKKSCCNICKKEVIRVDDNYDADYDQMEDIEEDIMPHFLCYEYKEMRAKFDKVLDTGSKMFCPGCGIGGRKDDNCTHMLCDGCDLNWCYFCGQKEEVVDKAVNTKNIYGHNVNFEEDEKRCPMYFTNICDIDPRWPEDDSECLDLFHRKRTIKLLRAFLLEIGQDSYAKLIDIFPACGDPSGYSLEDILTENVQLINREGDEDEDESEAFAEGTY